MRQKKIFFLPLVLILLFPFILNAQTKEEIKALSQQYKELKSAGKYQEAIPVAQKIVTYYEKSRGPEHQYTATSLNNLAVLYKTLGNYAEAEPLFKRALAIREKTLGSEHPNTATILNNLANLYGTLGNYAEAEPLYIRALAIREKALGPEHPDTATILNNLANLYGTLGNYAEAEPLYKRALAIREKALGPEHPDTANSLNNLALFYKTLGNYAEAEPLYKRALAIREKALGPEHPDTATILNNLANLYGTLGNYAEAEPLYIRALAICEKTLGPDHPDTARSLHNLAWFYRTTSNYAKSESLHKRVVGILERSLGPEHPDTATSLNNLARLYATLGNYAEAEPLFKRALAIKEKSLGPEHLGTAKGLRNLAVFYEAIGNYTEAEELYTRALSIFEKSLGPKHPDTVSITGNLALLWLNVGKADQAFEVFKKQNHNSGIAKCYIKQGKFQQAKDLLAIEYEKTDLTETKIGVCIGLGLSCEGLKSYSEAKKWFDKAVDLIEQQRTELTPSQREHFFEGSTTLGFKRSDAYEGMMRILLQENTPEARREAVRYAAMIKSRIFYEMIASRGLRSANPADDKVFEQDRKFQQSLQVLAKRLEVLQKPGIILPKGAIEQVQAEYAETRADYEAFLKEIRLQQSEVASLVSALPIDTEAMQSLLDDDVTVLEYYMAQDRTYAWLITANDIRQYEIKKVGSALTAKTLQANVGVFLNQNITGTRRPAPVITLGSDTTSEQTITPQELEQNRKTFDKKAQELYSLIIAPLEPDIKTPKLVIVPHDILHKVPFACLSDGRKALVDKYDLSVAPSSSLIEFLVSKRKADTSKFLGFANPATDKITLPFAENEVRAIKSMFPSRQVYSGPNATKTRATELSANFNVVHFACHGEFNDMQPLQSGLLLAHDGNNDGLLRIPDVFGLNLQEANLVTLSACETALSKVRGGEDWAGMSRGFIYAGTPSILATLWSVDDKSTAILMQNFYKNWLKKGMSKPAALRQAQLALKSIPEYSHPFYWAPFVMIGDWK